MDIKELLLNGCIISMPYKQEKDEWVGDAKLYIFDGYFEVKPKICFDSSYHRKEWEIKDIDQAIDFFFKTAFSSENLWYKVPEVQRELNEKRKFFDMEIEEDYEKIMNLRSEKLKEESKPNNCNELGALVGLLHEELPDKEINSGEELLGTSMQ